MFLEEISLSRQWKRDFFLGTWNVRSLYMAGSLKMDLKEAGGGCGDWSWLRIGGGGGPL
jgi:hypothetical protein